MNNSTALRASSLAIWLCVATATVLRGAVPEEYAVTDITAWSEAQLASLPHFDRYVPVAPAGAGGDFSPVAASGVGVTAGTRNPADSLGAFVNAGSQSDIAAWGTYRWSYWIWDGHDNHYYSGSVTHSPARDVNVFGQVVGYATLPGGGSGAGSSGYDDHAYLLDTTTGRRIDLTPEAHRADARGINDYGEIVGTWSSTNTYHPFRRAPDGTFTDFSVTTPHSYSISPSVINNHGHIAGLVTIWTTPRDYYAFFSETGGSLIRLPFPSQGSPDTGTIADLNDHDVIVGEAHKSASPVEKNGVRWTKSGGTWSADDLNEVLADGSGDFIIDRCIAVNDAGHIVASGHPDGTDTQNTRRFLLTPDVFARPAVTTFSPANVTATSATLRAKINACNLSTTWRFEHGPSPSYGSSTPDAAATGTVPVLAQTALTGLQPHTTYHVRASGTNAEGTTDGISFQFTTAWDWLTWATNNLGSGDPHEDANHNGSPDLLDYTTGNAPYLDMSVEAGEVRLSFDRSTVADGVTLILQVSEDLSTWRDEYSYGLADTTAANLFTVELTRQHMGSDRERITLLANATNAVLFARLKAVLH